MLADLGQTSATTLLVGLASLAVVLGLRRFAPMVPGSLVAVLAGIAAVWLLDLDAHGVEIVGQIDSGLPALGVPEVAAADYLALAPAAAGVMLVGFAEGLGAAKTYATRAHYEVDANRELLGLGAANLGAGLSSGMVVNGSLSKTAVNGAAGARSQVYRLNAPLLFVNAKRLRNGIRDQVRDADPPVRVVLLDLSFTPELDIESVDVLASIHHELGARGVALWLAGVRAGLLEMLVRSGLADAVGRAHLYRNVEDAAGDVSA